jgi:hypothetical protein
LGRSRNHPNLEKRREYSSLKGIDKEMKDKMIRKLVTLIESVCKLQQSQHFVQYSMWIICRDDDGDRGYQRTKYEGYCLRTR